MPLDFSHCFALCKTSVEMLLWGKIFVSALNASVSQTKLGL